MSFSLVEGLFKTVAVERVVAPISSHLCLLMLLCDSAQDPEQFTQLEAAAQAVAKAAGEMAAVCSRKMSETKGEVLQMEMSSLPESLMVSGQHVLLAAQKLHIQPSLPEHKEDLITATQNVFLGVVKVLLVDDDSAVRRIVTAADQVLDSLSDLGGSSEVKSLLTSFQTFSEALIHLNTLTLNRAHSLQDPRQTHQLLDSLDTLKRCIPMLHTALYAAIKHPKSEEPQAAKSYILDKVQNTISDIVVTLGRDRDKGPSGPAGYYTEKRIHLTQLLTSASPSSIRDSSFDSDIRDIVFHCMAVANVSEIEFQQRLTAHCRHVLQLWSDLKWILNSTENKNVSEQRFEQTCASLVRQMQMVDNALHSTVLHQVLDTLLGASLVGDELSSVTEQILALGSAHPDVISTQSLVENFILSTDRMIQVVTFVSAIAVDPKSFEKAESSRVCFTRLRALIAPLSLNLEVDLTHAMKKLFDLWKKWDEEFRELQDAVSDVLDVKALTNLTIDEMVDNHHGCDTAFREQSSELFRKCGKHLAFHMKLVTHLVQRHLERSDEPIYRNGLLVLLKQAQESQAKVEESVKDMLAGHSLRMQVYPIFTENVLTAIQHFKVLRQGLDGDQHPHLLSPLREVAREPVILPSTSRTIDTRETNLDCVLTDSSVFEVTKSDSQRGHEEVVEVKEAERAHKFGSIDLKTAAVPNEPKLIPKSVGFDLLPLLFEVVTVTKEKDVSVLNRTCTQVLELSNCYAQAAKEASAIVGAADCRTLEGFRSELVSLTPLLVQMAQETAMSPTKSTQSVHKHGTQFSDLICNIKKVLLPAVGTWYHAVYAELRVTVPSVAASAKQKLNDVMASCTSLVQDLTTSDIKLHTDSQETLNTLHNKLNKLNNNTRHLLEFYEPAVTQEDQLQGLCIMWALSVQIVLNSLDKILGMSTQMSQPLTPQKHRLTLFENSLRIQEASRLTSLNCKSAYKSKQFTKYQNELKELTEEYLKVVEGLDAIPNLTELAKSVFLNRHLIIKIRLFSALLGKENKNCSMALQNVIGIARLAVKNVHKNNAEEQRFKNASAVLTECVQSAIQKVKDSLNYIRDPRLRSNLRSTCEHMLFQITDIIHRVKLMVETRCLYDTLSLEVQIQCWSAKARHVVEEIRKQDGIHPDAKEYIEAGLQGKIPEAIISKDLVLNPPKEMEILDFPNTEKLSRETVKIAEIKSNVVLETRSEPKNYIRELHVPVAFEGISSLTQTSYSLLQTSNSWDPQDNRIVQVTRKMADIICQMTQYLRKRGPILNKEGFVSAAKDVIAHSHSVTQFIRVIANHSLDKQCTVELSLVIEQILTITNQLSIISSVKAVTPGCRSSDEILVKNAQNLLQTILRGVHAAETACITGLKQPKLNSDEAEATALCFQWKRNLEIHRAQQSFTQETDDLGLRKTSSSPVAPSLAPTLSIPKSF